jgi:hypothetical protein
MVFTPYYPNTSLQVLRIKHHQGKIQVIGSFIARSVFLDFERVKGFVVILLHCGTLVKILGEQIFIIILIGTSFAKFSLLQYL